MISKPAIVRTEQYKCRILETHLKLREQQLKTIFYIYIQTAISKPHVTANQISIIDIHTKKKKEYKHNTKESRQIIREDNKRGREEKDLLKEI